MSEPMTDHSFALSVPMPDDEPRQIVCTGEEAGADIWQPAFGTWSADDFGLDSDESVGTGERLYVSRRIYDALQARIAAAENMNPWAVRLCLPPTFLVGPVGLLLFFIMRFFLLRSVSPGHPS
jgi:hypothetical protein